MKYTIAIVFGLICAVGSYSHHVSVEGALGILFRVSHSVAMFAGIYTIWLKLFEGKAFWE